MRTNYSRLVWTCDQVPVRSGTVVASNPELKNSRAQDISTTGTGQPLLCVYSHVQGRKLHPGTIRAAASQLW
jgi:hypothetical protein